MSEFRMAQVPQDNVMDLVKQYPSDVLRVLHEILDIHVYIKEAPVRGNRHCLDRRIADRVELRQDKRIEVVPVVKTGLFYEVLKPFLHGRLQCPTSWEGEV